VVMNQNCSAHRWILHFALARRARNTHAARATLLLCFPGSQGPQLRALDMSGTAGPADPDLPFFHYGRNDPFSGGMTEHLLHPIPALQHVYVFKRDSVSLEVLTGLSRVRSCVFAEDQHFFLHGASHFCIT